MRGTLISIDAYSRKAGARVTVRAAAALNSATFGAGGARWESVVRRSPRLSMQLCDDDLTGTLMLGQGELALSAKDLKLVGDPADLEWVGSPIVIYSGDGTNLSRYRTEFLGRVSGGTPSADNGIVSLSIEVDKSLVDVPLLTATYGGGGGADGDVELRGNIKPAGYGAPVNIRPVLVKAVSNIYQVDAYGNMTGLAGVYENLASFGASLGDYPTFAALDAATIPEGRYATCFAEGLFRLGAAAKGTITCDPILGANLPGTLMLRWLRTHAAVPEAKIRASDFAALTAAVQNVVGASPTVSFWTQDENNVLDLLQRMAASCNASLLLMLDGRIGVSRAIGGANQFTLNRQGSTPPVTAWATSDGPVPWWRLKMPAARSFYVNSPAEIDYEDDIRDMGDYSATATYRQGMVVRGGDGARYLYINATPSSGSAPPNATYWSLYENAPDATDIRYPSGFTLAQKEPADAGATAGATWNSNVALRPANLAELAGNESVKNSLVTIGNNGALAGAGGGQVTLPGIGFSGDADAQRNNRITITNGILGGIGTANRYVDNVVISISGLFLNNGYGNGTVPIANSGIAIGNNGALSGGGGGQVTLIGIGFSGDVDAQRNGRITVDGSGTLQGIGTSNVVADNSKVTITSGGYLNNGVSTISIAIGNTLISIGANGALAGGGGGQVTLPGIGFAGDRNASVGDNIVPNSSLLTDASGWTFGGSGATRMLATTSDPGNFFRTANSDGQVITSQLPIPPGVGVLFYGFLKRASVAGQQIAIDYTFTNAQGGSLTSGRINNFSGAANTWTQVAGQVAVPSGAVAFVLTPVLVNQQGTTHDIAQVRVSTSEAGATLGAAWSGNVTGRPSNLAGLAGTESINNTGVSIGSNGALSGGGGGQVTFSGIGGGPVGQLSSLDLGGQYASGTLPITRAAAGLVNTSITISSGQLQGIGTAGRYIDNSALSISGLFLNTGYGNLNIAIANSGVTIGTNGALSGGGGGQVTIGGLGYRGDLSATLGDNVVRNGALSTGIAGWSIAGVAYVGGGNGDPGNYFRATQNNASIATVDYADLPSGQRTLFISYWKRSTESGQQIALDLYFVDGNNQNSQYIRVNSFAGVAGTWTYVAQQIAIPTGSSRVSASWTMVTAGGSSTHDIALMRLGTSEAGSTVGATWAGNLVGRPNNLTLLAGNEGINNAAVTIGANGVLGGGGGGQVTAPGLGVSAGATNDVTLIPFGSATVTGNTIKSNTGTDGGDGAYSNERIMGGCVAGTPSLQVMGTYINLTSTGGQAFVLNVGGDGQVRTYTGAGNTGYGVISGAALGDSWVLAIDEVRATIWRNGSIVFVCPDKPARGSAWRATFSCYSYAQIGGLYFRPWTDRGGTQQIDPNTGRVLDGRTLNTSNNFGVRSLFSPPTLSDTDNSDSVTINLGASSYITDWGATISLPSASFPGAAYNTTYYLWRVQPDPATAGTGYGISTNLADAIGTGKAYLGFITTRTQGSTTTGGGGTYGGTDCVWTEAWLPLPDGEQRAGEATGPMRVLRADQDGVEGGPIEAMMLSENDCVTIVTENDCELTLALNTPMTVRGEGHVIAANCTGYRVPTEVDGKFGWARVVSVRYAGRRPVAKISCWARTYAAGDIPRRYILTHNLRPNQYAKP